MRTKEAIIDHMPLGKIFGFLTKQYIGFLTKRLSHLPIDRYFHPFVLIGESSGEISQQQLADLLLTDKVTVVRIVDGLTKSGVIERKENPEDRRQHLLALTELGWEILPEVTLGIQETDAAFIRLVSPTCQEQLTSELKSLCEKVMDLPVEGLELYVRKHNEHE